MTFKRIRVGTSTVCPMTTVTASPICLWGVIGSVTRVSLSPCKANMTAWGGTYIPRQNRKAYMEGTGGELHQMSIGVNRPTDRGWGCREDWGQDSMYIYRFGGIHENRCLVHAVLRYREQLDTLHSGHPVRLWTYCLMKGIGLVGWRR